MISNINEQKKYATFTTHITIHYFVACCSMTILTI